MPTAPPGGENPAGSALGKVPRQELLLAMTPPASPVGAAKAWGREERRGLHENFGEVLKRGQTGNVTQKKSGLGNMIKWDMGPGMREIYRIWFPYL